MKIFSGIVLVFLSVLICSPGASAQSTWIVDQSGIGDFSTIQDCIDAMVSGDTCLVKPGTYVENINYHGKVITIRSDVDGESSTYDISPETTIIDGGGIGDVVTLESGESSDTVLEGFTIQSESGYGVRCYLSDVTIRSCIFSGSMSGASIAGGQTVTISDCIFSGISTGIYSNASWMTVTDCDFVQSNKGGSFVRSHVEYYNCTISDNANGGISCVEDNGLVFKNCTISNNGDHGIHCYEHSNATIVNSVISGNSGHGVHCDYSSDAHVMNSIISGNSGDGIHCALFCEVFISSCTLTGNSGYGFYCDSLFIPAMITDSIFWENSPPDQPELFIGLDSSVVVSYSDIKMENPGDIWPGADNINADPLFVAGPEGCYYLSHLAIGQPADSPCIDSGSNLAQNICFNGVSGTICMDDLTTRIDHVNDSGTVDMGYHHGSGLIAPCPSTVATDLICTPSSATVPFDTQMTVTLVNSFPSMTRLIAGHIDVTMASGVHFPNWRAGFTTIAGGGAYTGSWSQYIPNLGTVVGDNVFNLVAEDVTPTPYNQPPYPPAGDTATGSCTVTGIAP